MKNEEIFDVLIVGAGPSGSNTAISYKNLNPDLKVGIIDKAIFPRDKSCGDAIGPGVINALKDLTMNIYLTVNLRLSQHLYLVPII